MADSNNTSKLTYIRVAHPDHDNIFRSSAVSTDFLKASVKTFHVQCTQCQTTLAKPLKCAQCKSVWYCSKECQKKNWPTHKPNCHQVERSSGALKLVRNMMANPVLMFILKLGVILECGLLDDPRIGFELPFMAHVNLAVEPSDMVDFVGLYLNDTVAVVGEKMQGMVQVNAITAWKSTDSALTPKRLHSWREARARYNAQGSTKDPVGLLEFTGCANNTDARNSLTAELHIHSAIVDAARKREPFEFVSGRGAYTKPMNVASCMQFVNGHIRSDKNDQLLLRTDMTHEEKEIIRAAGRNEDLLPARILNAKMRRENIYTSIICDNGPLIH